MALRQGLEDLVEVGLGNLHDITLLSQLCCNLMSPRHQQLLRSHVPTSPASVPGKRWAITADASGPVPPRSAMWWSWDAHLRSGLHNGVRCMEPQPQLWQLELRLSDAQGRCAGSCT